MKRSRSSLFNLVWRVEAERKNKRGLSADGVGSLAPSALRPRLFGVLFVAGCTVLTASAVGQVLFAEKVEAASLTLTVPDGLSLNVTPSAEGTFEKSSSEKISLKTDAFMGYTLSIKAKDEATSNSLMNGSEKLPSIENNLSEEKYKTEGAMNTWGFLLSKVNSAENTDFLPGPGNVATTIEKTSSANAETANSYDMTLAAKVNGSLAKGTYKNSFVVLATANTAAYNFTFQLNSGSGGPSGPQTGNTTENIVKLDATKPTRDGYEFLGWCDQNTTNENCGGQTYQPGQDYTLTSKDNNVTFWAIWKASLKGFSCNSLNQNQTTTLIDSRDGNIYAVTKLLDNKCWMTENLRIGNNESETILTSEDSDVTNQFTLPIGNANGPADENDPVIYISPNDKYGGYYNWTAATAGTGNKNLPTGSKATSSICPKDWHLPTEDELSNLANKYNFTSIQQAPVNLPLAGGKFNCDNSQVCSEGNAGIIWSSTMSLREVGIAVNLVARSYNNFFAVSGANVTRGWSVRCVAN